MDRKVVWLYGDGPIDPRVPVLFFEDSLVICDHSECGTYMASKFMVYGEELPMLATLGDVTRQLEKLYNPEELRVRASNNGIAVRLEKHGVKTLKDLARILA